MIPCFAIRLKNMPKDANGYEIVIWATETQVQKLVAMRNDAEKRKKMVKIDRFYFSPQDIFLIEERHKETYDLPKYFLERYNAETTGVVKIT